MPPAKKTPASEPNLDDLLDLNNDDVPVSNQVTSVDEPALGIDSLLNEPAPSPEESISEQDELAALRAELDKPSPKPANLDEISLRPLPDSQLTPTQLEMRNLRDQLAKKKAREAEQSAQSYEVVGEDADTIIIHILEDGFTVNGEITYRGRELHFARGGRAFEQTKNRFGDSWLDWDVDKQYERWGEQKFGYGPWTGRPWDKLTLKDLPEGSTPDDLRIAQARAAQQSKAAPVIAL